MALVDQAVVSATSFLTTVIIGRCTDPSQLGAYAIGISVLASVFTIQGSTITIPYSIQRHRPLGTLTEHAGSSLAHSGLLSAAVTIVLTLTALGLFAGGAASELIAMTWALASVAPFALFREFCRQFAFTHLQMARVLTLDVAVAAIQLSLLSWLGSTGRLSAVAACSALGVSCGVVAVTWLYLTRASFAIRAGQFSATMRQSWGLGKWLFANQITVQVQQYIVYWLSVVIAGAAVTGVYAACMSVVSFANPLISGFGNIMTPRSVLAWKEGGGAGLRRQTVQDTLLLGAAMTTFCVVVLLAGENVMRFLYHSEEYGGHGHTVTVLAFAMLASAVGMPASYAMGSMERPHATVGIGMVGAVLTVVLVGWLMASWGLLGAAYGFLSGNVIRSVGLWVAFLSLSSRACDPAPAIRVLQMLTQTSDSDSWAITRLGGGDDANVYAVRSKNRQPIWRTYHQLVVKLYKPEKALTLETVDAQFDVLSRLHATLHGHTINDWKISTPRPLHICKSPLALIMSEVPGRDLKSCAASGNYLTAEVLEAAGRAFATTMQEIWSCEKFHGDLGLQNILCDFQTKSLSLVDPGTPVSCAICNDDNKHRSLAVLELGHILPDLGTEFRDLIGNPNARLRRQIFGESALRAYIETIGSWDEKQLALSEIRACAQAHLWQILEPERSLRGLWRWFLRPIVFRQMDSLLDRLRAELVAGDARVGKSTYIRPSRRQCVEV